MSVRLILDVMGGDDAPSINLEGAQNALEELRGELILVGNRDRCEGALQRRKLKSLRAALEAGRSPSGTIVRWEEAGDTIEMGDSIRAVRGKPNASINVGCRRAAEAWKHRDKELPTAFISAGHSGAVMASALVSAGRMEGIERPAIAVKLPTLSSDGCVILDVGANVDCKPEHLRDFAVMGAAFAQVERKSQHPPRVALLSNGEEPSKGNELTRSAWTLLEATPALQAANPDAIGRFTGYAEGKEIFGGHVDVVVTDGFVGNVVLKSLEGLGSAVARTLKREATHGLLAPVGFLFSAGVFRRLKRRLDYAEYGAAPLLGVAASIFICHGRSNSKAIKNALLRAQSALREGYLERLEASLRVKPAAQGS